MLQRTSGVDGLTVSVSVRGFILWDDGEKFDEEDSDVSKVSIVTCQWWSSSIFEFFFLFRSFAVRYIGCIQELLLIPAGGRTLSLTLTTKRVDRSRRLGGCWLLNLGVIKSCAGRLRLRLESDLHSME